MILCVNNEDLESIARLTVTFRDVCKFPLPPATLELTPGPTGLTYISHKAARRQPKVGTDQATNVPVLVSSVSMFILHC